MSVILTVASFKGGVGKTTTAVHLAAHSSTRARTILVDGDPNGSSARWAAAGKLPFEVVGLHHGQKAARRCEHLVIDTGARPNAEEMRALAEGCDMLGLPTTPDALSLDGLMQTITVLSGIGSNRFRILLTIVPPKPVPQGETARKALLEAGLSLFKAEIRRTIVFPLRNSSIDTSHASCSRRSCRCFRDAANFRSLSAWIPCFCPAGSHLACSSQLGLFCSKGSPLQFL